MREKYRVLVADPPWPFADSLPGKKRGAVKNYDLLSIEEIERFPLPPIDDDAYLFLWRVSSQVEEAYRVVRAWGFVPKSELVWIKKTSTGKRHFGMGRHVRGEHETCIIAVKGKPQRKLRNVRSTFEARAHKHSAKPDAFYAIVESLCYGPYVELFARQRRKGWTCVGKEINLEKS